MRKFILPKLPPKFLEKGNLKLRLTKPFHFFFSGSIFRLHTVLTKNLFLYIKKLKVNKLRSVIRGDQFATTITFKFT